MPRQLAISLLLAAVLCGAGCATGEKVPRLFWPAAQEDPRLEYLGIFASQNDLPLYGFWAPWRVRLLGPPEVPRLQRPVGIAIDRLGRILVTDAKHRTVWAFDSASGEVKALFNPLRTDFQELGPLQVDGEGRLFVVDRGKRQVLVYGEDLTPLFVLAPTQAGATPSYVAVAPDNRIYVSATAPAGIDVFNHEGQHLFTFGNTTNSGAGMLLLPQGMTFNRDGELLVADAEQGTIEVFNRDGSHLRRFGGPEAGAALKRPVDLASDSDGNLHVIDAARAALLTFAADGEMLLVTGSHEPSAHPFGFALPTDIAIDASDRIFIADRMNRRFSAWQYLSTTYLTQHPVSEDDRARLKAFIAKLEEGTDKPKVASLAPQAATTVAAPTASGAALKPCVLVERSRRALDAPLDLQRVLCPICKECVENATIEQHLRTHQQTGVAPAR